jgi:hypothetical protein
LPWSDEAVRNYDAGLRYDFKKSDGWELVNNSFSDSTLFAPRTFILYNKYRGLLRYYSYNPLPVNANVSDARWLVNQVRLDLPGNASPLFNYAGQFIVDVNANSKYASLVEPWPIQQSGWYISQFEMAYDRNAVNFPVPQNSLSWVLNFARVNEVVLNDVPATDKPVYLQAPGVSFNDIWSSTNQLSGDINLQVKSVTGLYGLSGIFSPSQITNLQQSAGTGSVGNFLSASLVPEDEFVDCKLGVAGSMNWLPSMVGYVPGLSVALPGPDNSSVIGIGPVFNEPMGIFYLGSRPVINHSKISGALTEQYSLDVASIEYIINPFMQQYAEVLNFRQEIVAVDELETKNLTEAKIYAGKILKASKPLKVLGVRVSFDVIPKTNSSPIKIIKTFTADVHNN